MTKRCIVDGCIKHPCFNIEGETEGFNSWGTLKTGIFTIKKTKQNEWTHRLHVLHDQIRYWIAHLPEKTIETIHLFYDQVSH